MDSLSRRISILMGKLVFLVNIQLKTESYVKGENEIKVNYSEESFSESLLCSRIHCEISNFS